jgi:NADPH2:quinone reductase
VPPFDIGVLAAKGSLKLTRPTLFTHIADPRPAAPWRGAVRPDGERGGQGADRPAFPLSEVAEAHRALEARATTGSTVLLP